MFREVSVLRLLLFLAPLVLTVFCVVDAITSRDDEVRHLGKSWWILLILFFPLVGSLAWLLVGRPRSDRPRPGVQRATPDFPEYDRPGRFAASDPEADAAFLRRVRERAEEQRRRHREQREAEERRTAQEKADKQGDADGEVAPG